MKIQEIISLIAPLIGVSLGVFIKVTKSDNYVSAKKYWLFLVIGGVILFLFRLYKSLKS
ncbi:hypothetical protein [Flavobacterium psychrophilum]|uniref:hypothetical protein n=1 Tax=Flavobacterium psychrophilum TaxID=96345 RepID=UPI0013F4CECA|nr:hypothetical protein [Flavobacterium psychrophilum]